MGISYRFFRHPGEVHSLEQAALERGQRPEQVVRSILFRLAENTFAMVLVAGPNQVAWFALRKFFGQSRLTIASSEEVLAATGYLPGSVSPFGLPTPMRILVDNSVLDVSEISIGSGLRGTTIILRTEDMLRALGNYETGSFTKK